MGGLGNGVGYATKSGSNGTVTSVGLSAPSIFTVGGSPVTVSGTLSLTLANQTANKIFASPNGSSGTPTFRALVANDIPALPYGTVTSVGLSAPSIFTVGGSPVTASGTLSLTLANQTANTIFAAPNGSSGTPTFRALVANDIPSLPYWGFSGNALSSGNFLGSTNDFNVEFKRNNVRSGLITGSSTQNTFYGLNAGLVTTGLYNTFIGDSAGKSNTTGLVNSAFGVQALFFNTTGRDNVGFGANALYRNTSGNENMGIGSSALEGNTTGVRNVGIGGGSGFANSTGSGNISIGHESLKLQNTGSNNIAIGFQAASLQTLGTGNIILGSGQNANSLTGDYQMNIGGLLFATGINGNIGSPAGRFGIRQKTPSAAAIVEISGTDGGLIIPRLTTAERNALALVAGNMIYNTTDSKHQGCNGTAWFDFY